MRIRRKSEGRNREHPSAVCELGRFECEIMALKDAISEGVNLEDHEHAAADGRSMAGAIVIDSEPYVVLLRPNNKDSAREIPTPLDAGQATAELTKRELQIASLVAEGKANKQIAYQLKISEWTVSTHLRRIFVKLRVNSRANMVALLMSRRR